MRTARLLLVSAFVAAFSAAHAQTGKWPEKPVRIIIAAAPGGGDIVDTLNAAIRRTLAMPDIRDKMINAGSEPQPSSPEELGKRYAAWAALYGKVAKEAGLKPQ